MARNESTRSAGSALRTLRRLKQFQSLPGGGEERFPAREISGILSYECGPCAYRFQRNQQVAKVADEIHLPVGTPRAAQQNAGINPCRRGRRREVTEGPVRLAKFIQNSLFPMVVGTGIEFGGHNGRQDGALEDSSILAQPEVVLSPAEPDVNASIEQKRSGR
jgi:hypothetical protein